MHYNAYCDYKHFIGFIYLAIGVIALGIMYKFKKPVICCAFNYNYFYHHRFMQEIGFSKSFGKDTAFNTKDTAFITME